MPRTQHTLTIHTWRRLSCAARRTVEGEAAILPVLGIRQQIVVRWD
jgi:hypothetical protein